MQQSINVFFLKKLRTRSSLWISKRFLKPLFLRVKGLESDEGSARHFYATRVIFASRPFVALHHDKTTRWHSDCDLHCAYDHNLWFTSPVRLSGSRWSIFFHFHSFDYQYQWVIHPNLVTRSNEVGGGGWRFRLTRLESGFNLTLPSMTKASEICEPPKKKSKRPRPDCIVACRAKELFSSSDRRTERVEHKTSRWVTNTATCNHHTVSLVTKILLLLTLLQYQLKMVLCVWFWVGQCLFVVEV